MPAVFRFAPSPNGYLHLGHAYSALLNQRLAEAAGGVMLLRIEDIDLVRCRPELVEATFEDLRWLGLEWQEPVLRQSSRFDAYRAALDELAARGLVYPCFCTRKALARAVAAKETAGSIVPRDPDDTPLYGGHCRTLAGDERKRRLAAGLPHAWRLDSAKARAAIGNADLFWQEAGQGQMPANALLWGDVILARKDTPTSYHLAVVIDDAAQGVTDVVRGRDLYAATAVHRLLQILLGLDGPRYRHHRLITDAAGQKLAKSKASTPLRQLRAEGWSAAQIRDQLAIMMDVAL